MLGDLLELVGLVCLVVATYLLLSFAAALVSAGVALFYLGQCYSEVPVWRRKK